MTALWNDGAAFSLPLKRKLVTALSILTVSYTHLEPITVTNSPLFKWRDRSVMAFFSLTVPGLKVLERCV